MKLAVDSFNLPNTLDALVRFDADSGKPKDLEGEGEK